MSMTTDKYVLEADGSIRQEPDLLAWAKWYETAERQIARDELANGVLVSTVFLGLDHAYHSTPPILFETMIFGGEHDQFQDRYVTRDEAIEGHAKAVAMAATGKSA